MNDFLPHISTSIDQVINSLTYFYPELGLSILFIAVIICDLFFAKKLKDAVSYLSLAGILVITYLTSQQLYSVSGMPAFSGMIWPDRISIYFKLIFCVVAMLFVLFIRHNRQLQAHAKGTGDLYAVLIAVLLGLNLMAMANNLLMIYLSVEMVSIGSYIMVGYVSANNFQSEAAMKYALFGGVCSSIMLYGMSLVYAFTGTLNLDDPALVNGLKEVSSLSVGVALTMIVVGLGFKLSLAPFHLWSPDVYEGAPTPVTAFLSTAPKAAGFAILIRFLTTSALPESIFNFAEILGLLALITMIVGNFSALWQNNIKRMLAYSSIGHTGFMMMAILSFSHVGMKAVLFYLFVYSLMNMAAFMLADYIEEKAGVLTIKEYQGLGKKFPISIFAFVVVLISLTGLPPTAGFIGKLLIFSSALGIYQANGSYLMVLLMAAGAVTTVVALFYYIKVPLNAYLRTPNSEITAGEDKTFILFVSLILMSILVILGVFPQLITDFIMI